MGARENAVKAGCLDVLALAQAFVWPNNTGRLGYVKFGYPGSPDIIGLLPGGKFIGVETKAPADPKALFPDMKRRAAGKQSAEQIEFQKQVEKLHGIYVLAHSSKDLEDRLREEGYL